jgi:hypothetical protein
VAAVYCYHVAKPNPEFKLVKTLASVYMKTQVERNINTVPIYLLKKASIAKSERLLALIPRVISNNFLPVFFCLISFYSL